MKILLLTRYDRQGASSRVRALQYLPYFQTLGWQVDQFPFFSNAYLNNLYAGRPTWKEALFAYLGRIKALLRTGGYDLLWFEKELFPYFPALAERLFRVLDVPYIVDYDDAIFHRYDMHPMRLIRFLFGRKIDVVMKKSSLVIAGSSYLAERASRAGAARVEIVPTVVDLKRYFPRRDNPRLEPMVVGWIGTPETSFFLCPLREVFGSLQARFNVKFEAVGATRESLGDIPADPIPWSENSEVESIHNFDIGIMPLIDSPWARGKCGYKLIQYMACGLPVVASPVGMNNELVVHGKNGFLAHSPYQWVEYLALLLEDESLRESMGKASRDSVVNNYTLQIQAPRLSEMFKRAGCL